MGHGPYHWKPKSHGRTGDQKVGAGKTIPEPVSGDPSKQRAQQPG